MVDFDALRQINPDVVAWIRFDEPAVINYPVVQGSDNSEYLSKTFKGYDNTVGTIFVNAYNHADFNDRNTIIYGHYMYNGTMFNELEQYHEKSSFHKYVRIAVQHADDGGNGEFGDQAAYRGGSQRVFGLGRGGLVFQCFSFFLVYSSCLVM